MLDSAGNMTTGRFHIGGGGNVNTVAAVSDGSWLVGGEGSYGTPAGDYNSVIARVDASGTAIWNTSMGGDGYDWLAGVVPFGGGAVGVGWTTSPGSQECFLVRLDNGGSLLSTSIFGANSSCYGVVATLDGGIALTGSYAGNTLLLKLDAGGAVQWSFTYGPGTGYDLGQAADGGFGIAAKDGNGQFSFIRTDANGATGCETPAGVSGQSNPFLASANGVDSATIPVEIGIGGGLTPSGLVATPQCF
jgi:hypothetical protein